MKKTRPPRPHDLASQEPVVGVAWYTSSEWSRVKAAAADPERFEESFEEWLVVAEDALVQLRSARVSAERFLVNADDLAKWCVENRLENNSSARARFVSEQLQARSRDGTNVTAMNTTIRLADARDHNKVFALVLAFRDHSHQRPLPDAAVASSVEHLLVDPMTDFLLVLSERGDAIGYAQLRYQYSLWVSGLTAQLEDVFVVSSSRRHGIGLQLLNAAVARATERLARFIWLIWNERNLDAVRLYTRAGFSSARERWQGGRQLWLERAL